MPKEAKLEQNLGIFWFKGVYNSLITTRFQGASERYALR